MSIGKGQWDDEKGGRTPEHCDHGSTYPVEHTQSDGTKVIIVHCSHCPMEWRS